MNKPDHAALDKASNGDRPTGPETRSTALNRLRQDENERPALESVVRRRLMWLGGGGATVGLSVGYMATLVTIVDSGVGEFGFSFYRPDFVQGFVRIIPAYIFGGGFVGGVISYTLFTPKPLVLSDGASPGSCMESRRRC